jgi:hypothetical protein
MGIAFGRSHPEPRDREGLKICRVLPRKRSGDIVLSRRFFLSNKCKDQVMAEVTVYRFKSFDGASGEHVNSTRMATRQKIDLSKTLTLIEGSGVEIEVCHLLPGEEWTAEHFAH